MTTSDDTAEFYQARAPLRKGGWFVIEGDTWMVEYALEDSDLGDFARWFLKQQLQERLRARRWWKRNPPLPWVIRTERPTTTVEEVTAWLATAFACWQAISRR